MEPINREILKAMETNLIVYISGLQNPYLMGKDNSHAKWTLTDVGKLYASRCMTLPLDMRTTEQAMPWTTRITDKLKSDIQAHFRVEFFNILQAIEYYSKPRETAVAEITGPYRMAEPNPDAGRSLLENLEERLPFIGVEDIVQAAVCTTDKDRNPLLMETFGAAVRRGARDYISLKTANDLPKRAPWKVYREYDLIMLHIILGLEKHGFLSRPGAARPLFEELAKDKYSFDEKRDDNGR